MGSTSGHGRRGTHDPTLDRYIRTEERRAFRRWPVRVAVECQGRAGTMKAEVVEFSEAGLTFTSERKFLIGEEITLRFNLPKHTKPIKVMAAVRQVRGNTIGVEFLNLQLKDRVSIQDFFAAHAKGRA